MIHNIHVHRVQGITVEEIAEGVTDEGQRYCFRKIILKTEGGDFTIHTYGDEGRALNLFVNATVAVEEPTGDGYAESMDGSAT